MSDTSKILITNYHCASNRGDAAIMEGLITSLKGEFSDVEITIATEYPDASSIIHNIESVEQRTTPFDRGEIKKNVARIYALFAANLNKRGISPPKFESIIRWMNVEHHMKSDIIVGTGGQHITDLYFPQKIGILWELYFAKCLGKPVILVGQSAGKFEDTKYAKYIKSVLNRIDMITARDKQTIKYLRSIGVTDTPIHFTADAAFAMDAERRNISKNRYEAVRLPNNSLSVSISVRKWSQFSAANGQERYKEAVAEVADWLVGEKNATVQFVSTCTGLDTYHKDDRIVANNIVQKMDYSDKTNILYGEYAPQELVEIYGEMDAHIGTRMHSNILAVMGGTPVVPIQYQFKTKELAEQLGIEKYLIDIDDISSEILIDKTSSLLDNRDTIEKKIEQILPEMRRRAKRNAEIVHHLTIQNRNKNTPADDRVINIFGR